MDETDPQSGIESRAAQREADLFAHTSPEPANLHAADRDAIDQLVDASAALPDDQPVDAARRAKAEALLSLIALDPANDPPAGLAARTMAAIRRERMVLPAGQHPGLPDEELDDLEGFALPARFPEFAAIAALVIIGVSLALPVLWSNREQARRMADMDNLSVAGRSMGQYAADNEAVLPRRQTQPGTAWFNVGAPIYEGRPVESNSAHLFQLARQGYVDPQRLNSPANLNAPPQMTGEMHDWPNYEAVSYSYQNQFGLEPTRTEQTPELAILANKNPMFHIVAGELQRRDELDPLTPSMLYNGQGQNVLLGDGSVLWLTTPVIDDDNIWLIEGLDHYDGREIPRSPNDAFLVP